MPCTHRSMRLGSLERPCQPCHATFYLKGGRSILRSDSDRIRRWGIGPIFKPTISKDGTTINSISSQMFREVLQSPSWNCLTGCGTTGISGIRAIMNIPLTHILWLLSFFSRSINLPSSDG